MPRKHGHPKENKPWDREPAKTRKRRKRVGKVKEHFKSKRSN